MDFFTVAAILILLAMSGFFTWASGWMLEDDRSPSVWGLTIMVALAGGGTPAFLALGLLTNTYV